MKTPDCLQLFGKNTRQKCEENNNYNTILAKSCFN